MNQQIWEFAKLVVAMMGGCVECIAYRANGWGPSHNGYDWCRSGSIASGGVKAHCTCDSCF